MAHDWRDEFHLSDKHFVYKDRFIGITTSARAMQDSHRGQIYVTKQQIELLNDTA